MARYRAGTELSPYTSRFTFCGLRPRRQPRKALGATEHTSSEIIELNQEIDCLPEGRLALSATEMAVAAPQGGLSETVELLLAEAKERVEEPAVNHRAAGDGEEVADLDRDMRLVLDSEELPRPVVLLHREDLAAQLAAAHEILVRGVSLPPVLDTQPLEPSDPIVIHRWGAMMTGNAVRSFDGPVTSQAMSPRFPPRAAPE